MYSKPIVFFLSCVLLFKLDFFGVPIELHRLCQVHEVDELNPVNIKLASSDNLEFVAFLKLSESRKQGELSPIIFFVSLFSGKLKATKETVKS